MRKTDGRAPLGLRPRLWTAIGALLLGTLVIGVSTASADPPEPPSAPPPLQPIDPQLVQDQDDMTWDDYRPIPNTTWADPTRMPSVRGLRILLVAVDFPDQPFVMTLPKNSDLFGNPQVDPIARSEIPAFYRDHFMNPNAPYNNGHTIHEYWMEQSRGRVGVSQMDVAGPYRMPKFLYQYSLNEFNQNATGSNACPAQTNKVGAQTSATNLAVASSDFFYVGDIITIAGVSGTRTVTAIPDSTHITISQATTVANNAFIHDCSFNMDNDVNTLFRADLGCTGNCGYDVILRIYAGYDETTVWQEFGEMKFQTQFDVPDEWGNPNPLLPNWAITRYVPWTSWKAAAQQWGLSSIRQGESSGTITHEMGHFFFSIGDNNNNPFATPYHRVGSAPWDMMDRGSFNGPGGHHKRWVVPVNMGGWMPAGLLLRNKITMNFLPESNILRVNRNGLAGSGVVVDTVVARAVEPGPTGTAGIRITLDGSPVDRTPSCNTNTDPFCHGNTGWNHYTMEVSQRIGYDSFTPDSGVIIAKNKTGEGSTCGYNCFNWVIDANPQDMNMVDYYKPDGTPIMRTIGDHRQLNDAAFHAGTSSGSEYEWVDTPNRLHFYVIDKEEDADGVLRYKLAVRSLDGAGPHVRGVDVDDAPAVSEPGLATSCSFPLANTGTFVPTTPSLHPEDVNAYLTSDVYRLSVSAEGAGWSAELWNALAAVKAGESQQVPVYVTRQRGSAASGVVRLTATSESDPTKTATAECAVTVPAPGVAYELDPASPDGDDGWYRGDVELDWSVTDADSTVGCGDETFASDGLFAASCTATSDGGTTGPVTVAGKRDATAPAVAVTGVADGGVYVLGAVPDAGCETTDVTSGVAADATVSVTGGPLVGFFTATCSGARDTAGNPGSASVGFQVVYDFDGFLATFANPPLLNPTDSRTIQTIWFRLAGDQGLDILASGSPASRRVDCDTGDPLGPLQPTATPSWDSLYYQAYTGRYSYPWKPDKAWKGTCREFVLSLRDGTSHSALLQFVN